MLNHARTLLLNEAAASQPASSFLAEFIDPLFSPVVLSSQLVRIQKALLGENSDSGFKNATLHALTTLLHSTEFEAYVKALDSRITYLDHQSVVSQQSRAVVNAYGLTIPVDGLVVGVPESNIGNPRVEWLWHVTVSSGGPSVFNVNVRWEQGQKEQDYTVAFEAGQSELIPLIGQPSLFFKIRNNMLSGEHWSVSLSAVPKIELFSIVSALNTLGPAVLGKLFTPRTASYSVFEKLWRNHPEISYKLSGLLLALIYRIEEIRLRGQ